MNRKNLEEFIDLYKSYPCLWQTKSKLYHDRPLRKAAYKVLVEKLKEFEPDANKDFVVKKNQQFKKQRPKIKIKYEASVKSGASSDDVYRPKLWYYDMMNFLNDQDTPQESTSNWTHKMKAYGKIIKVLKFHEIYFLYFFEIFN